MANLPASTLIFATILVAGFLTLVVLFCRRFADLMQDPHRPRAASVRSASNGAGFGGGGDAGACGGDGGGCGG
jgi:uncharacterized membrane protein